MTKLDAEALALKFKESFANCSISTSAWGEHFQELEPDVARSTAKWFVQNHSTAPSIAGFLSEYRRQLHANDPVEPEEVAELRRPYNKKALEGMGFGQYYALLLDKASRGDREAIEMLEVWEQNFAAKKPSML